MIYAGFSYPTNSGGLVTQ